MGFIAFPMPELFPRQYWLFHSLWHCFLAAGYYELYALIEQDSLSMQKKRAAQQKSRKHAVRHAKKQLAVAKMQKADSNSSMDSMSVLASSQSKSGSEVC